MWLVEKLKNRRDDKNNFDNVDTKTNFSTEKLNAEIKTSLKRPEKEPRANQKIFLEGDLNNALEFKEEEFNFDENYENVDNKDDKDFILSISKKKKYGNERTDDNCNICSE